MQQLEKQIAALEEELMLLPQKTFEEITLPKGLQPLFVRFCNWGLFVFPRSQFESARANRYVRLLYKNHSHNSKLIGRLVSVFDRCIFKDGRSDKQLLRETKAVLPGRITSSDLDGNVEAGTPTELLALIQAGAYLLIKVSNDSEDLEQSPFPKIKIGDNDMSELLSTSWIRETVARSRGFVLEK